MTDTLTLGKALNLGLRRAMEDDAKVVLMGGTSADSAASSGSPTACRRTSGTTASSTPR